MGETFRSVAILVYGFTMPQIELMTGEDEEEEAVRVRGLGQILQPR